MQIPCEKYDCEKAVEVCYWTCRFNKKGCPDWVGALEENGTPGFVNIQGRLEAAAKKSGREFNVKTLRTMQRQTIKPKE